jgi:hypothetical protein
MPGVLSFRGGRNLSLSLTVFFHLPGTFFTFCDTRQARSTRLSRHMVCASIMSGAIKGEKAGVDLKGFFHTLCHRRPGLLIRNVKKSVGRAAESENSLKPFGDERRPGAAHKATDGKNRPPHDSSRPSPAMNCRPARLPTAKWTSVMPSQTALPRSLVIRGYYVLVDDSS